MTGTTQIHDHTELARRQLGTAAPLWRSWHRTAGFVIGLERAQLFYTSLTAAISAG